MRPRRIIRRLISTIVVLFLIGLGSWYVATRDFSSGKPTYGVTFSQPYAEFLGLNWRDTYTATLDDLNVSSLRLVAYWNLVEPTPGTYNFVDMDWQIEQAQSRNRSIILTVGRRLPRWPECHDPSWLSSLSKEEQEKHLFAFVQTTIERYRSNPSIVAWQIENEPLFAWFGDCPAPNKDLLAREVALVRQLDGRPVVLTDTGELGTWQGVASLTDTIGTTLYRVVWNPRLGYWRYWFVPPAFYHYKAEFTKFFHPSLKNAMITELQMEPWAPSGPVHQLSPEDVAQSFAPEDFMTNVEYARKTGLSPIYLWGVEYWYWAKLHGQPAYWDVAKSLWK